MARQMATHSEDLASLAFRKHFADLVDAIQVTLITAVKFTPPVVSLASSVTLATRENQLGNSTSYTPIVVVLAYIIVVSVSKVTATMARL